MHPDDLLAAVRRQPFVPFRLHVSDGSAYAAPDYDAPSPIEELKTLPAAGATFQTGLAGLVAAGAAGGPGVRALGPRELLGPVLSAGKAALKAIDWNLPREGDAKQPPGPPSESQLVGRLIAYKAVEHLRVSLGKRFPGLHPGLPTSPGNPDLAEAWYSDLHVAGNDALRLLRDASTAAEQWFRRHDPSAGIPPFPDKLRAALDTALGTLEQIADSDERPSAEKPAVPNAPGPNTTAAVQLGDDPGPAAAPARASACRRQANSNRARRRSCARG